MNFIRFGNFFVNLDNVSTISVDPVADGLCSSVCIVTQHGDNPRFQIPGDPRELVGAIEEAIINCVDADCEAVYD